MKINLLFLFIFIISTSLAQQSNLQSFPLTAVRLTDGPFKQAQQTDLEYILTMDADRLLAPYLREAGIAPKAESYGNWENTGLDGHIGGHYLSALSLMFASTGDQRLQQRLTYMLGELERCQQKNGNGYIGGIPGGKKMWEDVAAGKIKAGGFSLNDKWVPLYNIHKLFAGLLDAYEIAGQAKAKQMLIGLSEWFYGVTKNLSDEQVQTILRSEHGGLNEVFADVSRITGDKKYMDLARRMSHRFILNPLIKGIDSLNGQHANTQIPKVIGFKRIADLSGDNDWSRAADFFWQTVTQKRSVSFGGNSVREHFHPATDFSSMIETREGPETCNTYNMLKLTKQLFLSAPSRNYMDYYERALYNHILSSQHPDGGFVYFTPVRPRHYRVYSQPHTSMWCCVGSGLENHGKYGEMIYAHDGRNIYVNLFIPSSIEWKERGIRVEQQTNFPYEEQTNIKLHVKSSRNFSIYFRNPSWVRGGIGATVNGKPVSLRDNGNGYSFIQRKWRTGDVISLQLPMQTRAEFLPDGSAWFSFVRGPIVLAAATDTTGLAGLRADASRMAHIAQGPIYPIESAPIIVDGDSSFTAKLDSVRGMPFTYTAASIIDKKEYKDLRLVPFYTLHDTRYMLYWRYATPEQYERIKEELRISEQEKLALEAITVDQVAPGEQQPESDHNFRGEQTESGVHRERHWRTARGWFSYDLRNKNRDARILRVTYFGLDRNRSFDILVNGRLLKSVKLNGEGGDKFIDTDYTLPDEITKNDEKLTVRFEAHENSVAGGIFYVRLLK